MNILILSWRGPGHPQAGGAEISTHEHAKGWVKAGHKVTLFTSYYPNSKKQERVDGIYIIRRGNQYLDVHMQAIWWYIFGNHPKFDLVVDQFHGIPFFTPFFVRAKKLAFIHETAKEVWSLNEFPPPFNFFVSIFGNILEPLIFAFYKKIPFMTVSDSTKNDLSDFGINKQNVMVIHNGVYVPKISEKKEDKTTVVYLGVLTRDKGIETALEVFQRLQERIEDIKFWVVGKGNERYVRFLKSKADSLRITDIKFWGYVDETEKFRLLSKSHILINPSIKEGWGIVVIEAAAMGTPTVAFSVPGLKDSIINGKTGYLSKKLTAEGLASKSFELLEDDKKLASMRNNAVSWSKRFSWEKSSAQSLNLINKLVIGVKF